MTKEKNKTKSTTIKQAKFTKEYIKTGNATKSAIKAGYSKNSARQIASENLSKPVIREAIRSAAEKLGINPEYVLGNFKEIADFNKQKRIKAKVINGETYNEEEMIDAQASIKANEMLGKHLKLFTDQVDIKAEVSAKIEDSDKKKEIAKKLLLSLQNPEILGNLDF